MALLHAIAALLLCSGDPLQRVHDQLFLRTAPDGKRYGAAELDPLLFPDSRWILEPAGEEPLLAALEALHAADLSARPARERLVLQRDLWAAFDWVFEHQPEGALAAALARALRELGVDAAELGTSAEGVADFPSGLLDASGGWVRLADALGRSITPAHDRDRDGRSRFEVLLRLPGGRAATLAWLERLRALPDPRTGVEEERHFRADLPLLPAESEVALVRRALAIDARGELVATQLVESVQLRRFLVEDPAGQRERFSSDLSKAQQLAEFRLDRSGAHELRALGADEYDFSTLGSHGEDPFDDERSWSWRKPGLVRCAGCHAQPGIYSVNSFTRVSTGPGTILIIRASDRPSVLVEADPQQEVERALAYKRARDSWKALVQRWSSDPRWERLRRALFVRSAPDGKSYGEDELDPLLYRSSSHLLREPRQGEIQRALDDLLAAADPAAGLDPLRRALLQRELWSVFDWLVEQAPRAPALEERLARLVRALALDARELHALPAPPDGAGGTAPGLFTAQQGWVRLADQRGRPMAPVHLQSFGGRSHFEVLMRLPGGRDATLAYLASVRDARAEPPQFPVGTAVALVRRAVLFDSRGELVLTPLVESVELRTYLAIVATTGDEIFSFDLSKQQDLAVFQLSRKLLLAGQDGGLRRVGADDPDLANFATHGEDPFEDVHDPQHWVKRTLQRCGECHKQIGIYGVNSFTRLVGGPGAVDALLPRLEPTVLVEGVAGEQAQATLAFKRASDSWKALQPR